MKTNQKLPAGQISPKHRGSPRRPLPILVALVVLAAISCTDVRGPLEPAGPLNEISDAMHNQGNAHFFFLPPMVSQPSHSGTFDASLSPVVTICAGTAPCDKDDDAHLATYTMTEGHGSEEVRLSTTDEHYHVNWHTNQFELTASSYRIRVSVAGTLLGFADVQPVSNGKELKNLDTNETIGLVDGRTLPIKFRVEKGAVFVLSSDGGTLQSSDGAVTLEFPAGAIDGDIGITVTPASDDLNDPDVVPGTVHGFGPSPYQFAENVMLTIRYDAGNLGGLDPSELRIFKIDGDEWIQIAGSGVNAADNTVSAPINSFSRFGVGGPARVHTVTVSPSETTLAVGGTEQLTVELKDVDGNELTDREIAWESDATAVASVSEHGLVTAHEEGTSTITALSQGKRGSAMIRVEALMESTISAGLNHTCGLSASGAAYCWGGSGKLGANLIGDSSTPVAVEGGHIFTQIQAGQDHTIALTPEGDAYTWGSNGRGQLGVGSTTASRTPVKVGGDHKFVQVAAGNTFSFGISADASSAGSIFGWGRNDRAQLGDGTREDRTLPVKVQSHLEFAQVSAGSFHAVALTRGGAAYAWGWNNAGQSGDGTQTLSEVPVAVLGGHTFTQISAGIYWTLALKANGTAYAWGLNTSGQLGNGTTTNLSTTPQAVQSTHVFTQISAGGVHGVALNGHGKAFAWGNNEDSQLGDGTNESSNVPVAVVGDHTFARINAGGRHTIGVKTGGAAFAWGFNQYGQLGDGTTDDRDQPVAVIGGHTFQ
jgi:alpha-tubulin suppressor-like RCC1 family protein